MIFSCSLSDLNSFVFHLAACLPALPFFFSTTTLSVPSPLELCTYCSRHASLSNKSRTLLSHFILGSTQESFYQEYFLDLLFKMAASISSRPLPYLTSLHIIYHFLIYFFFIVGVLIRM